MAAAGDIAGAALAAEAAGAERMVCAAAYGARPGQAETMARETTAATPRRRERWLMRRYYESARMG
jgi:hypothetical protein